MTPPDRQYNLRVWDILSHHMLRELGIPSLVVSLVLFVSAMTLLGASVSELRAAYGRVQQSNEAILQVSMVNTDILRVEMIVRGYALSGDPIYLRWQKEAVRNLRNRIATFAPLFSATDDTRGDVVNLRRLTEQHIATFDGMARRVPSDRQRVIAEIVDYGKKVKRRAIENLLVDMRADLAQRLAVQQQDAESRVVNAYRYAAGISAVALLFGAFGFALLLRHRGGQLPVRRIAGQGRLARGS